MSNSNYQILVTKYEYEKNPCGFAIKKCCASCAHKVFEDSLIRGKKTERWRMCKTLEQICVNNGVCDSWVMSSLCKSIGQGEPGDIKKLEYLQWIPEELSRRKQEAVNRGFKVDTPAYHELVDKFEANPRAYYDKKVYHTRF